MQGTEACQFLEQNQWLSNAVVTGPGDGGRRVLADISADGHRLVCELGFQGFVEKLRAMLPPELQGRDCLQFRAVRDCMPDGWAPGPGDREPAVLSRLGEADRYRLLLRVDAGVVYFQGHFPGNPILPGIAQLHWAAGMAMRLFGYNEVPYEVKRLKFKNIIRPASVVELVLEGNGKAEVEFGFSSEGQAHSTGCLCFIEGAPC